MRRARPVSPTINKPEQINGDHVTSGFQCGYESLDDWLKRRALKSHIAGDSKVYVVCDRDMNVVGYYAISAGAVSRKDALNPLQRNAPDPIPVALIGRLAVRQDLQGHNIGPNLLKDAMLRIAQASKQIGIKAILVHAIDDDATSFYTHMGFKPSPTSDRHLMISLREVAAELNR